MFWIDIYNKKLILSGISLVDGRFFPFAFMDLNILMQISKSPYLFFSFNAFVVICVGALFWQIIRSFLQIKSWICLLACIFLFLNPSFIKVMLGICYPERLLALFLLIFVVSSYKNYTKPNIISTIIGIISANLAIYLKEPTFLIIGCFGFLNLVYAYFTKKQTLFLVYCILLILSAIIFLGIYGLYIVPNVDNFYGTSLNKGLMEHIINLLNGIKGVSLIHIWLTLLLPCIVIFRIYHVVKNKDSINIFLDSLLICGILYLMAYLKLGLFRPYYFIPIYCTSLAGIIYYSIKYYKNKIIKAIGIFCIVLYTINAIPQGIWTYIFLKSQGVALIDSLDFLNKFIKENPDKVNIYFDGIGRGYLNEEYFVWQFGLYLEKLYNLKNFDIKANTKNQKNSVWVYIKDSNITMLNSDSISTPQKDDLIILNANSLLNLDKKYIQNMNEKYELLYKTNVIGIPQISLKTIIKYILRNEDETKDNNPFRTPINNYIYRVK